MKLLEIHFIQMNCGGMVGITWDARPKRKEIFMEKMTLEEYLSLHGYSSPVDFYMIDKIKLPHGETQRQKEKREKEIHTHSAAYHAERNRLIDEFNQKAENGEIIVPSRIEQTIATAKYGHPDNSSTQAAIRMLHKRGYTLTNQGEWVKKDPKIEKERIFVDMDGVLATFNPVASEEELYEKGYFANLEPMTTVIEGMKQYIKENPDKDIYILSAYLTDNPFALQEKNEWLDRHLPEIQSDHRIFCLCGKQKADYIIGGIKETDILIDDYTKNLIEWKQQGGIGVKLLNGINGNYGTWQDYTITKEKFYQDFTELFPMSRTTIRCQLSEHPGFDEGKLYTIKEFDGLMKEYDKEWQNTYPAGSYAKVKFTVNLPNATTITERQDIGDGYGGVVDFLKNVAPYKNAAHLLEQEIQQNKKEFKEEHMNPSERIFKTYQKIWNECNTETTFKEQQEQPKKHKGRSR